ncbi:MAG: gamma-glutamylcyclotransferase [Gammaproteobacteria bacterium]|nr:gamma-glutamylcyclotransferase [Gammaproteobacteria bacterium]|tara:strand:+ start:513 stop:992 length:480 start_codon:yes stop_codon:yes gene_type:complete
MTARSADHGTRYFAYGSNMNPERVRERGLRVLHAEGAVLDGFRLTFDKHARAHEGMGHASVAVDRGSRVEGVLYWLEGPEEIVKMDRFESAPINYSREMTWVATAAGAVSTWTYFANPAVLRPGLRPPRAYLDHLLAGAPYLSAAYHAMLAAWPCAEDL